MTEQNALDIFPVAVSTTEAVGENIEFSGEDSFSSFWNINKDYLYYTSYFLKVIGTPLFYIKETDKV